MKIIRGKNGGKRPGAGRPPGSINKKSYTVAQLLESIGYDAIGMLVESARSSDEHVALRARCELIQYVHPKLKSIETKITGGIVHTSTARQIEAASDADLIAAIINADSDEQPADLH